MQPLEFPTSRLKEDPEFNASETRKILQELFPTRKLVLSQFTFFNQIGVSKPSGESFRRGRRCYRAQDLLPIAVVLALKEQGIPNKNILLVPGVIQENCEKIFKSNDNVKISGYKDSVSLNYAEEGKEDLALNSMLESLDFDHSEQNLYWSYDVSSLAHEIEAIVNRLFSVETRTSTQLRAVA